MAKISTQLTKPKQGSFFKTWTFKSCLQNVLYHKLICKSLGEFHLKIHFKEKTHKVWVQNVKKNQNMQKLHSSKQEDSHLQVQDQTRVDKADEEVISRTRATLEIGSHQLTTHITLHWLIMWVQREVVWVLKTRQEELILDLKTKHLIAKWKTISQSTSRKWTNRMNREMWLQTIAQLSISSSNSNLIT